jgi:predicted dehydrogenase
MTTKIGMIGCGSIAEHHVNGYLKVEDAQVTAVCDVVEENARRRAEQAGGAQIFHDVQRMLATADIDAVDICLPHHLHKDAIVASAAAGKAILCEKPLCLTLEEAAAVKKAVSDSGVMLMCAHNQVFVPSVRKARQLLDEGILGEIYEIRTLDSFYNNFDPKNIGWRAHREMIGGGELIDTGYHPSYLLLYLAASTPSEVTAMLSTHRLHFMDGEDSAQVLVRFADGSVGNIVSSWAYDAPDNTEKFQIVGERGAMYCRGNNLYYKLHGSELVTLTITEQGATGVSTYHAEVADFVACLREKRAPIQNVDDGINVLKVILGAYQSVAEKRTIAL